MFNNKMVSENDCCFPLQLKPQEHASKVCAIASTTALHNINIQLYSLCLSWYDLRNDEGFTNFLFSCLKVKLKHP